MSHSQQYIQAFNKQALTYRDSRIIFDRAKAKSSNVRQECWTLAKQYMGKDFNYLYNDNVQEYDESVVLRYIHDVWGFKSHSFFTDTVGDSTIRSCNLEQMLLFFYYVQENMNDKDKALGLLYFVAGQYLTLEFEDLIKLAGGDRIKSSLVISSKLFGWKRCPAVTKKFMLHFSVREGYNSFVLEKPLMGHIAFLMRTGMDFQGAENFLMGKERGIFFSFLPLHVESALLPAILTGVLPLAKANGVMATTLQEMFLRMSSVQSISDKYNIYTEVVKPAMIEFLGLMLTEVSKDLYEYDGNTDNLFVVSHLSEARLGILVPNNIDLRELLPSSAKFFKMVEPINWHKVVEGDFI